MYYILVEEYASDNGKDAIGIICCVAKRLLQINV